MGEIAISAKNISKCFKRYTRPVDRLQEIILPSKSKAHEFWALQNINLEILKGQTIGIIGQNGSGKSTLLQIIVGTLTPTIGEVNVSGRLSALLELGSGFNMEFTGRQNVFFNGRLLGLSQKELENKFDEIAGFADIGDFIDQPVKTYSSGMFVRLAFAVAINVNPDILIVDEALAVGDARFQQRCMARINQLRNQGITVLFVSHDSESVKRLCNYAVILEKGKIVNRGSAQDMVSWYLALMTVDFDMEALRKIEESASVQDNVEHELNQFQNGQQSSSVEELALVQNNIRNGVNQSQDEPQIEQFEQITSATQTLIVEQTPSISDADLLTEFKYFRHGDGNARILRAVVKNQQGQEVDFVYLGEVIKVCVEVEFFSSQDEYLIGMLVRDRLGTDIIGINTYQERITVPKVSNGDKYIYCFSFAIDIKPGIYSICPSVAYDQYKMPWLDWIENALVIRVIDKEPQRLVFGIYHPPERDVEIIQIAQS